MWENIEDYHAIYYKNSSIEDYHVINYKYFEIKLHNIIKIIHQFRNREFLKMLGHEENDVRLSGSRYNILWDIFLLDVFGMWVYLFGVLV